MRQVKPGDIIASKNDTEFYCRVVAVSSGKVEVEYTDMYEETSYVDKDVLTWEGDEWSAPNWSINLEQV